MWNINFIFCYFPVPSWVETGKKIPDPFFFCSVTETSLERTPQVVVMLARTPVVSALCWRGDYCTYCPLAIREIPKRTLVDNLWFMDNAHWLCYTHHLTSTKPEEINVSIEQYNWKTTRVSNMYNIILKNIHMTKIKSPFKSSCCAGKLNAAERREFMYAFSRNLHTVSVTHVRLHVSMTHIKFYLLIINLDNFNYPHLLIKFIKLLFIHNCHHSISKLIKYCFANRNYSCRGLSQVTPCLYYDNNF